MSHVNIRIRDDDELTSAEMKDRQLKMVSPSKNNITTQDSIRDLELQKRRWKNRRRMAWLSLITMISVTFLLLFGAIPETRLKAIAEPITWFYFSMASIIGAYMGFTTWASRK